MPSQDFALSVEFFFYYCQGLGFHEVDDLRVSYFNDSCLMDAEFVVIYNAGNHPRSLYTVTSNEVSRCYPLLLLFHVSFVVRVLWNGTDSNCRRQCQMVYSHSPLATRAPFHGAARGSQTHLILITSEVHDRYARAAKSSFQLCSADCFSTIHSGRYPWVGSDLYKGCGVEYWVSSRLVSSWRERVARVDSA